MKDRDYVNFSEDHELNYMLRKYGKRQTADNRKKLGDLGVTVKKMKRKTRLTHGEFYPHIERHATIFESL